MTVELLTISLYQGKPNMYFYYCLHYLIKFVMIYKCKISCKHVAMSLNSFQSVLYHGVLCTVWCESYKYNLYVSRIHCFLMHYNCA